jgi:hypothetical protein
MEQLAELLKVQIGGLASRTYADKAKSKAERKADKTEMKASQEEMMARMEAIGHKMDSNHERMMAKMDAWLGKTEACREEPKACEERTKACLEEEKEPAPEEPKAVEDPQEVLEGVMGMEEEPDPEETEVVAGRQEVPKGATDAEAIGAAKDRSRDLRLAVGCRGRLKTRIKRDGRLRQECSATVRLPTHSFVPALRKGGLRKGPGKRCRRNGVRGPGETSASRMEGRGLKQRRAKDSIVRGAPKQRTRKVFENGIRDRSARLSILRRNKRRLHEAFRHKFEPEAAKLVVESSIRLRVRGTDYCGNAGPRRSGRDSAIAAPQGATAIDNECGRFRREIRGEATEERRK